jgi:hypothetical protein
MDLRYKKNKVAAILLLSAAAVVLIFLMDPIPQDRSYHLFADTRKIFDIRNFFNVVSNHCGPGDSLLLFFQYVITTLMP